MKYPKHSFEMRFSVTITVFFLIFSQVKCTFTKLLVTDHTCNTACHSFKHMIIVICNENIRFNHRNTTV